VFPANWHHGVSKHNWGNW